jgi:Mg2+ and Co2+ transporter CorA
MKEADRVKTAFLHHMTDQMIPPVSKIESDVESLEAHVTDQQEEGIASLVQEIDEQGKVVTGLLNHLLEVSQAKEKEDDV